MRFPPEKIHYLPECQSTNTEAAKLIASGGAVSGACISTDRQTAGRGQRGNSWVSGETPDDNGITASYLLQAHWLPVAEQFTLSMAAALAVADTVTLFSGHTASVKWPNDIMAAGKKIAGILIENSLRGNLLDWSIIGIGLNVNRRQFELPHAGSLALLKGASLNKILVQAFLSDRLGYWLTEAEAGRTTYIRNSYTERLFRIGVQASFRTPEGQLFTGVITGISNNGLLEIACNGSLRQFDFKEVVFVLD